MNIKAWQAALKLHNDTRSRREMTVHLERTFNLAMVHNGVTITYPDCALRSVEVDPEGRIDLAIIFPGGRRRDRAVVNSPYHDAARY